MASCIPQAIGVPGMWGEAPQWWNSGNVPRSYNSDLLDPRWDGAVRHGYQLGTAEEGIFRAVQMVEGGQPVLYLSWRVIHDPSPEANTDGVYVAFQRAGGPQYLCHVGAYSSLSADFEAQSTTDITLQTRNGTGPWSVVPNPAWLNDVRTWLVRGTGTDTSCKWAINMRVPTISAGDISDAGINLGDVASGTTFKFWYAIIKAVENTGVVPYYWPRAGAEIGLDPMTLENIYPAPSTWDDVKLGSGVGCGTGISLSSGNIGTTNPNPNEFKVSTTTPQTNTVRAMPLNGTGAPIPANTLAATFRTANWGSQADFSFAAGATPWEEILPGSPPGGKRNGADIANGALGTIQFDWTISTAEAADWTPPGGTKWTHQCMLVTLSGPYDFINDSVYRNMDFVQASEVERLAEVSVQGLEPLPGLNRAVYLYVERNNMPHDSSSAPEEHGSVWDYDEAGLASRLTRDEGHIPTLDDMAAAQPTIRFHVYHETADRIKVGEDVRHVLREQTSFGHFVQHEGEIYGWDYALGGEFKQIADNLYRLEVPEGWKAVIRTRVRAWESPPPADRGPQIEPGPPQPPRPKPTAKGCLGQFLAFLAAIVAAIRKLVKSS